MDALKTMQARVRSVNEANGWFDHTRTFGDDMALLHSEVSETFEAFRDWGVADVTTEQCKSTQGPHNTRGVVDKEGKYAGHTCKPEGVGSELADVLVRLLDTCERYDIDLQAEFDRKLEYNATRGYHHGGKSI